MNDLKLFEYESKQLRTVIINSEPWWVAKDICDILGYSNSRKAVDDHCKGVTKRYPLSTPGGIQEVRIINEPDLYRLIVKSTLPSAVKFENWIFEEVLPQIRKTGSYSAEHNVPKTFVEALRLAADQAEQIEVMQPKAEQYDLFISNKNHQKIGDVAKTLNIKPHTLHKMLRDAKILQANYAPYAGYEKYFHTVNTPLRNGINIFTSYLKPVGVYYIAKRFNLSVQQTLGI